MTSFARGCTRLGGLPFLSRFGAFPDIFSSQIQDMERERLRGEAGDAMEDVEEEDTVPEILPRHFEDAVRNARRSVSDRDLAQYSSFAQNLQQVHFVHCADLTGMKPRTWGSCVYFEWNTCSKSWRGLWGRVYYGVISLQFRAAVATFCSTHFRPRSVCTVPG